MLVWPTLIVFEFIGSYHLLQQDLQTIGLLFVLIDVNATFYFRFPIRNQDTYVIWRRPQPFWPYFKDRRSPRPPPYHSPLPRPQRSLHAGLWTINLLPPHQPHNPHVESPSHTLITTAINKTNFPCLSLIDFGSPEIGEDFSLQSFFCFYLLPDLRLVTDLLWSYQCVTST